MKCAKCDSENIRLFNVIYEEGTSVSHTTATSTPNHSFSWNASTIKRTTTHRTALASRCAPPSDPDNLFVTIATVPSLCVGLYVAAKSGALLGSFWVGLVMFLVGTVAALAALRSTWERHLGGRAAMERYRQAMHRWNHSWLCMRCGSTTLEKT